MCIRDRSYTDKLNLANQETDKLKLQVEDYQKQKEDAEGQLNDLKGDSGSTVNQYATLAKILDAYRKGDMNTAVLSYVDMDQSKITDDSSVAILNEIKADTVSYTHLDVYKRQSQDSFIWDTLLTTRCRIS